MKHSQNDQTVCWGSVILGLGNGTAEAFILICCIGLACCAISNHLAGEAVYDRIDGRMDRFHGGAEACAFTRSLDFAPSNVAFDAAFDKDKQ